MTPYDENFNYVDWMREEIKKQGMEENIFPIAMEPQTAIAILERYLLGPDWYVTDPLPNIQVNTCIVESILMKYSPKFRKELKKFRKENVKRERSRIKEEMRRMKQKNR